MTDTPRTESELLERSTRGGNRGQKYKHTQFLRDLVVSVGAGTLGGGDSGWTPSREDAFNLYATNQNFSVLNNTRYHISIDTDDYPDYDPDPNSSTNTYLFDPLGLGTTAADPNQPWYGDGQPKPGGRYLKDIPHGMVWAMQAAFRFSAGTFTDTDEIQVDAGPLLPHEPYSEEWTDDTTGGIWNAPNYGWAGKDVFRWHDRNNGGWFFGNTFVMPSYPTDRFAAWDCLTGSVIQLSGETQTLIAVDFSFWRIG